MVGDIGRVRFQESMWRKERKVFMIFPGKLCTWRENDQPSSPWIDALYRSFPIRSF
jgi:hypothetical protein